MSIIPAVTAKPEIAPITDLLESILAGELRVPRFQRPYVWTPEDMIELFDSVRRGYPIGALLIWQTERTDISSLSRIGPIDVPAASTVLKSYVVDGHQRLATMLGVLRLPDGYPRERVDDWRWWIAYDLRKETFLHLRGINGPIPFHLLPLRSILRTVDFARWAREAAGSGQFSDLETNELLDRADAIHRAIRDYRIPAIVMRSASLDDAVTIFSRVNQRGREMTPDQMVSALTFRDLGEGDFDLAAAIDGILGNLRSDGFGDLPRSVVLQVILALAGLDFTRPSYERVVNRDSYKDMRKAVARAGSSMQLTVDFLIRIIGLKTSRLLPYSSLVVMLAIFFAELEDVGATKLDFDQRPDCKVLAKWFWATSFNGWFAGANTTDLRQAGERMRGLARNLNGTRESFEEFFFKDRPIRPFPASFDRRSARVRVSLLVQILSGKPLEPANGRPIDGAAVFADDAARDIPYFFPNRRRPEVSNPANRVILPNGYSRNARGSFTQLTDSSLKTEILQSHFIEREAFQALLAENFHDFIAKREAAILNAEQQFLKDFGLHLDVKADRSTEEVDTKDE